MMKTSLQFRVWTGVLKAENRNEKEIQKGWSECAIKLLKENKVFHHSSSRLWAENVGKKSANQKINNVKYRK